MESTPEQQAEGMAVVRVLAAVLDRLVGANASLAQADPGQVTKFHALKAPGIGILQYLERIHKYASCSTECFILALIYIDRLIQRNNFLLTELNVHRVVITAVLLAAKFFDDAYYNNAYYAKVGGVLVSEMNGLEVEFLFRINFSLHVQTDVFTKYRAELVAHAAAAGLEQPKSTDVLPKQLQSSPHVAQEQHASTGVIAAPFAPTLQQQQHQPQIEPVATAAPRGLHHDPQHITPSPPLTQAGAALQPQQVSDASSAGTASLIAQHPYAGLAHTHPGVGLAAACHATPFPQLQRHNSMPVTTSASSSLSGSDPATSAAVYSVQTGLNVSSHLVTPGGAVAAGLALGSHDSPYALPNCSNLSEAERLLVAESAAIAAYPVVGNQYVSHYQHPHQAGAGATAAGAATMHHYNHTADPLAHHHVTPVVGGAGLGGCRYGQRRYSDAPIYAQEAAAPLPVHIPAHHQASQYAGGYGQ